MDEPQPLMQVRDDAEGDEICERLRSAGIKCAVELLPDANSFASIWGFRARDALTVLVNESDMDRARSIVRDHLREATAHRVTVCETKAIGPGSTEAARGFEATCECDWTGPIRDTSEEAMEDARAHSPNVDPDIVWVPREDDRHTE